MILERLKQQARRLKVELFALHLACRDPRVPWYAKAFAICVVSYAFSPIDLIPDFIPVLGYLDDLIVVPIGIMLVVRMIPPIVMAEYRIEAQNVALYSKPKNWTVAAIILIIWVLFALFSIRLVIYFFNR